ncbi:hypothetical protein, partial [Streptomyces scabiei]|uniref:hypothetical protein n=1 Tax=Streptomyces scabiei TaxID=1930 RepID=UPI0039080A21
MVCREDLVRLLLAEFAVVHDSDFFVVPLTLPSGSVCRITSLELRTTYGETIRVGPTHSDAGTQGWQMFRLTGDGSGTAGSGLLLLPPCAVDVLDGPLREEVVLTRDETV